MIDPLGRLPVTIVTGFLGAGKTTLLNQMLTGGNLGRVAALVNDFGTVNIDAALVSAVADEVVELSNGCVCCTINGDLLAAAQRVLALDPPVDRIVVETTGLADPLPVGLTFLQTELRQHTSLDAVVTVVDCANFPLDLFKVDAAMAQIVHADLIVLNKTDLADPDAIRGLQSRMTILKPQARMLQAVRGRVPLSALVGLAEGGAALDPQRRTHEQHVHDDRFRAHAYRFNAPLSAQRFQAWLDRAVPPAVFRAKGLVRFSGDPLSYVFQLCGARATFDPWTIPVNETTLVFIGQQVDAEALERDLRLCLE